MSMGAMLNGRKIGKEKLKNVCKRTEFDEESESACRIA
jgi:hypothetical protein